MNPGSERQKGDIAEWVVKVEGEGRGKGVCACMRAGRSQASQVRNCAPGALALESSLQSLRNRAPGGHCARKVGSERACLCGQQCPALEGMAGPLR
jgi:hypothetical protein